MQDKNSTKIAGVGIVGSGLAPDRSAHRVGIVGSGLAPDRSAHRVGIVGSGLAPDRSAHRVGIVGSGLAPDRSAHRVGIVGSGLAPDRSAHRVGLVPRSGASPDPTMPTLNKVPPHIFFLVSAIFHYLGPAFAVLLFADVSVLGVA